MDEFIKRLIRSCLGTLIVYRIFRKTYKVVLLKKTLKKRHGDILLENVSELNLLMKGHAYLHDLEVPFLAQYAKKAANTIVEIGCAFGASSAIFLAHANKNTTVHSIDPFVVDSMAPFQATKEKCARNVNHILSSLGKTDKIEQWKLHTDYSYNLVKQWTIPIDVLFIDGNHYYQAVSKDFNDWLPHVKTGGVIIFHDSRKEMGTPTDTFNRGWSGPTQLAQELLSDNRVKFIDETYSISVFMKMI